MEKCQWVTLVTDNLPRPLYEGAQDPKATSQWVNMFYGLWMMSVPATAFCWSLLLFPSHGSSVKWVEAMQGWERRTMMGSWHLQDWACLPERWAVDLAALEEEKRYHTSFQIITGALCSIYVYVCFLQFKIIYYLDESCSDIIPHLYYLPNCPALIQ